MNISAIFSFIFSISADPTTINILRFPIATICVITLLYARYKIGCLTREHKYKIRKQEKDDDAARSMRTVKTLSSTAEAEKNSASTRELADVYCTVTRTQTNSQHNDNLPDSDSDGPRNPFRSPKK